MKFDDKIGRYPRKNYLLLIHPGPAWRAAQCGALAAHSIPRLRDSGNHLPRLGFEARTGFTQIIYYMYVYLVEVS